MPFPIMAAVALAQAAYGAYQANKGSEMAAGLKRPTMTIAPEMLAKLSDAQIRAMEGLSDEQRNRYLQSIERSTNFGLRSLSDRKAGIAGLSTLVQNENDAFSKMHDADVAAKKENERYLGTVQSEIGGIRNQMFETNELAPYTQASQSAAAMKGAGIQNIGSAVQTGVNAYGQSQYVDALKEINGVKKTPITDPLATPAIQGSVAQVPNYRVNAMGQDATQFNTGYNVPQQSAQGIPNPNIGTGVGGLQGGTQSMGIGNIQGGISDMATYRRMYPGMTDDQILALIKG